MKPRPVSDDEIKAAIETGARFTKGAPAAANAPDVHILPPMTSEVKEVLDIDEFLGIDEFLDALARRISAPNRRIT